MIRPLAFALIAFALTAAALPASGQKFLPKSIQFKGDPEYSNEELLTASGLKKGTVLSYAEMNEHSKRLMDTGVFDSLSFKFDGQDLIFQLTPSDQLFPVQLDNLPLTPGKDLDAQLHERIPLYHGKVPAEGGLTEDVRHALEGMLEAQGIKVTVEATGAADLHTHKVAAVSFTIAAPPVQVKVMQLSGVSSSFQSEVQKIADAAVNIPFNTMNSAESLANVLGTFYRDRGFAAVKVQASQSGHAVATADSILVPFSVAIQEGQIYKAGAIHLPPGTPITQAEVDATLAPKPGGPVEGVRLRTLWSLIATRYRAKGYLDCKVTPQPEFNDTAATVSYTVAVDPGPVYHLAFVKFDNVSDQLRAQLIHNWQLMPGDPFDESYVADFILKVEQSDPALQRSLAGVKTKFDATADPVTHNVNVVIRLEKP